jgi:signal transduction histidine kinase
LLNLGLIFVEDMPVEYTLGISPDTPKAALPRRSTERGGAVATQVANTVSVGQKFEVLSDEHCASCRDALASAAHELKTPLAIMGGYLQLLLGEQLGPLNPRQMEVLTEMQANGARLSNFVQNLLTYATLKVDRFEMQYDVGDINNCVREIAEVWAQRFQEKAIAFYFLPGEKLQRFPFDYYKVQHIVSNLLDNAVKYTTSSGTVWLHIEPYFWERRTIQRLPAVERRRKRVNSPNCCRILISDTGPGIAPEFQQEIFEEYFRLTTEGNRAEGYGLGLAIARRLVQAAGGKIWVESEPGNGSKFSFLILLNPSPKRVAEER